MAASAHATTSIAAAASGKRKGNAGRHQSSPCFLFLAVALAAMAAPSWAAVYKVGGSAGWTMGGNVSYTAWATSKAFRVGDTIVFEYNKKLHSVMEVTKADYRRCSTRSPLATHATGNDSVVLDRAGHRYFLCGVPGHCALGQKLHVRVPKARRSSAAARAPAPASAFPVPSPSPSSSSSSAAPHKSSPRAGGRSVNTSVGGTAPAPRGNSAAPGATGWAVVVLAVAVGAALVDLISC